MPLFSARCLPRTGLGALLTGAAVFGAALAGCSSDGSVRDAGFAAYLGELEEELRIDGHAEDLVPIRSVAVSADGVVALTQRQDASVRLYHPDGGLFGTVGGRGQGPGEFTDPMEVGWLSDTLWVYEGHLGGGKVTLFAPDLSFATTFNIQGSVHPGPEDVGRLPAFQFSFLQAVGHERSVFVVGDPVGGPFDPVGSGLAIARVAVDATVQNVVLALPASEEGGTVAGARLDVPFVNRPAYAVSPYVNRAAVAMAALDGPDAGTFSLIVVDLDGDTLFARRYPLDTKPIASDIPMTSPITGLLLGYDATIWIERTVTGGTRSYSVIRPDGTPQGTVVVPENILIRAATLERIWVVEADPLDVESLVRYRLRWGRR